MEPLHSSVEQIMPGAFDDAQPVPSRGTNLPLDAFLWEGDEKTWSLEEWNWDPESLFGVQKENPTNSVCCDALSRGRQAMIAAQIQTPQMQQLQHQQPLHQQLQNPHHEKVAQCQDGYLGMNAQMTRYPAGATQWNQQNPGHANVIPSEPDWANPKPDWANPKKDQAINSSSHWIQPENGAFHQAMPCMQADPIEMPTVMTGAAGAAHQRPALPQPVSMVPPEPQLSYGSYGNIWSEQESMAQETVFDGARLEGVKKRPLEMENKSGPSKIIVVHQKAKAAHGEREDAKVVGDVVVLQDAPPEGSNQMVCQVVGCSNDLKELKEYHHRYHICDIHIRLPQVMKDGRLQRFCQQCGRFHDLVAFDNNRKSCREQLSKHNARRRMRAKVDRCKVKPQPLSLEAFGIESPSMSAVAMSTPHSGGLGTTIPLHATGLESTVGFAPGFPAQGLDPLASNVSTSMLVQHAGDEVSARGASAEKNADTDVGQLLTDLMAQPAQLNALRMLLGIQSNAALPVMRPFKPESSSIEPTPGVEPASYTLAREILDGNGKYNPKSYLSDHASLRVSMKLFGRTPADLPPDMKNHITSWLSCAPIAMEGLIRPGCVFFTAQFLLDVDTCCAARASGVQGLVRHLLHHTNCLFWKTGVYTVQVEEDMASLTNGKVTGSMSACPNFMSKMPAAHANIVPQLLSLSPICVVAGAQGRASPVSLKLAGSHLDTPGLGMVCRFGGQQLKGQLRTCTGAYAHLTPFSTSGLALVELTRNAFLTDALPLLVVDDPAIAAEGGALVERCGDRTSEGSAQLHKKLCKVLAFACDQGWTSVVKALMHSARAPVDAVDQLSFLHRAVRSGSLPTVQWGPLGITPLHLAALVPDVKLTLALLNPECCPRHKEALSQLVTDDGVTPFHLALQMGHFDLSNIVKTLAWSQVATSQDGKPALKLESRSKKHGGEVDPCEVCHSHVPPLLLSIAASCYTCGMDRPCLSEDDCNNGIGDTYCSSSASSCTEATTGITSGTATTTGTILVSPANKCSIASVLAGPAAVGFPKASTATLLNNIAIAVADLPELRSAAGPKCGHSGRVTLYRIKALCQSCHVNRCLEAAC
eukprot:gene13338-19177_t